MALYTFSYEKDVSDRPLRCPVDPFAIVLAHPKGRGKTTHTLLLADLAVKCATYRPTYDGGKMAVGWQERRPRKA